MKTTVPVPPAERPVEEEHVLDWANLEVVPMLKQARQALNARLREKRDVVTGGGSIYARLWTSQAMPTNAVWTVEVHAAATATGGGVDGGAWRLWGAFNSVAGTVAQMGATVRDSQVTDALIFLRFGVDVTARTVYLEGRDNGVKPLHFQAVIAQLEAVP